MTRHIAQAAFDLVLATCVTAAKPVDAQAITPIDPRAQADFDLMLETHILSARNS